MSVQAAVAWLNKNNASSASSTIPTTTTTTTTTTDNQPITPPIWKKHLTPEEPKAKNTEATLKRIRTPSSTGGVASILSKFDSPGASTMRNVATQRSRNNSVLSSKPKEVAVTPSTSIDTIFYDLIHMHQDVLDQCQTAQDTIQQMQGKEQKQHTMTTTGGDSDRALIRDYEIRIQYLSEKVEQLSAEHDDLEHQLALYRDPNEAAHIATSTIMHAIHTPISSGSANHHNNKDDKQRRTTVETKSTLQSDPPDDFWNCLLDSYEKDESVATAPTMDGEEDGVDKEDDIHINHKAINKEPTSEELLFIQKQLVELEKGAQLMFEYQARELHVERSQSQYLAQVVEKQGRLIHILEEQLSMAENGSSQLLLQEQVELQKVELEDKRALLGRLLDEREDILQQHRRPPNRSRSASVRSSIDILSEMSKTDGSSKYPLRTSSSSLQYSTHNSTLGRCTPPPTAPPRDPLPPLPFKTSLSIRGSLSSAAGPASNLSLAPSWSSAEYAAVASSGTVDRNSSQHRSSALEIPTTMTVPQASVSSPLVQRQSTTKLIPKKSSRGSSMNPNANFWKGWKHRFGSRS